MTRLENKHIVIHHPDYGQVRYSPVRAVRPDGDPLRSELYNLRNGGTVVASSLADWAERNRMMMELIPAPPQKEPLPRYRK